MRGRTDAGRRCQDHRFSSDSMCSAKTVLNSAPGRRERRRSTMAGPSIPSSWRIRPATSAERLKPIPQCESTRWPLRIRCAPRAAMPSRRGPAGSHFAYLFDDAADHALLRRLARRRLGGLLCRSRSGLLGGHLLCSCLLCSCLLCRSLLRSSFLWRGLLRYGFLRGRLASCCLLRRFLSWLGGFLCALLRGLASGSSLLRSLLLRRLRGLGGLLR